MGDGDRVSARELPMDRGAIAAGPGKSPNEHAGPGHTCWSQNHPPFPQLVRWALEIKETGPVGVEVERRIVPRARRPRGCQRFCESRPFLGRVTPLLGK